MAGFEQKEKGLFLERQTAPCEILRLVRPRGDGQALPMIFHVHAYVDDHVLKAAAKTAKDAFAKAIEWHVVGRLTDISISDGNRSVEGGGVVADMAEGRDAIVGRRRGRVLGRQPAVDGNYLAAALVGEAPTGRIMRLQRAGHEAAAVIKDQRRQRPA
jgi:hypothetical protein